MSYLGLPSPLSGFGKATVSLWFRIPQATREAARQDWENRSNFFGFNVDGVLMGVIPLISWGPIHLGEQFTVDSGLINSTWNGPSFIGVQESDTSDDEGSLVFRFQSNNPTGIDFRPGQSNFAQRDYNHFAIGVQAGSQFYGTAEPIGNTDVHIAVDTWHHLVVSFDVSTGPHGKLWFALDDTNYNGNYLYPAGEVPRAAFGDGGGGSDPNGIIAAWDLFPFLGGQPYQWSTGFEPVNEPFGIPVPPDYSKYNLPVEMADLQIFTGQIIDTGNVAYRRIFVDQDGKPVPPVETPKTDAGTGLPVLDGDGNPVMEPPPAEKLLGKKPDILLHGSGNWIKGINTGPPKIPDPDRPGDPDAPPVFDPAKQFTPTGKVVAYSPDPSLHGLQEPVPSSSARRMRIA